MAPQFLTTTDVNSLYSGNQNPSSFLHLNAQSLCNKEDEVMTFLSTLNFHCDILMITETWYRDNSVHLNIPRYNTYTQNRQNRRGGGILIAAKESLKCYLMPEFSQMHDDYEILSLKCGNYVFSVLYRPPSGNVTSFFQFLDAFLSYITENKLLLVLGGDINIDFLSSSTEQREMQRLLECNSFCNLIREPTRPLTSTSLDAFITNVYEQNCVSGVICAQISDHLPIFLFVKQSGKRHQQTSPLKKYQSINEATLSKFCARLANTNWNFIYEIIDAETAYDNFITTIRAVYEECFPYKFFKKPRKARKPWINKECLELIQRKDHLYKRFLQSRNLDDLALFRVYRNKVTSHLRRVKNDYLHELFNNDVLKRSDLTWNRLNHILNPNKDSANMEIDINDERLSGRRLANCFNDYFVSLVHSTHDPACLNYLNPQNPQSAFLFPTNSNEIQSIFLGIRNSRSRDVCDFQILPFKRAINILSPILAHIFNCCFKDGIFPKSMQNARVTVIYKGGDRNNLPNYRPISILPIFSKCLEKIIHVRMSNFCEKHHLITLSQHGFRKFHSTETALLTQKELILNCFEQKELALGIYVDFSKAFDRINHYTLLAKLRVYGFRGVFLNLIRSYLTHRHQQVVVNDQYSDNKAIPAGVPQGSILGPLLFNLYINDIVNISDKPTFVIYADDTSLFFRGSCLSDIRNQADDCLRLLHQWSLCNSLPINTNKTKAVLFRPRNKVIEPHATVLKIGSDVIETVPRVKSLGVLFEEHLQWNDHVDSVAVKLSRTVGILSKFRNLFPQCIKKLLYYSLFYSVLNYCYLVWGTTSFSNTNKLYTIQKRAVRNIASAAFDSPSKPIFEALNIIPITELYNNVLLKRYKFSIKQNAFLVKLSNLKHKTYTYDSRAAGDWFIPKTRTNYGRQMISYRLPSLLNSCNAL